MVSKNHKCKTMKWVIHVDTKTCVSTVFNSLASGARDPGPISVGVKKILSPNMLITDTYDVNTVHNPSDRDVQKGTFLCSLKLPLLRQIAPQVVSGPCSETSTLQVKVKFFFVLRFYGPVNQMGSC